MRNNGRRFAFSFDSPTRSEGDRHEPRNARSGRPLRPPSAYSRTSCIDRVTRVEDTIVLCHLGVPRIAADDWSLSIDGLVRQPMRLTLDDLMRRPRVDLTSIHQCCGSPMKPDVPARRICNVAWSGVRLADLLADCEPDPAARYVWSSGADYGAFEGDDVDAFVKDLPLDRVAADVLVAYAMNGAPLRPENGYPVRLVVPGFYGTNSVKWLTRLTARGPAREQPVHDALVQRSRPRRQRTTDRSGHAGVVDRAGIGDRVAGAGPGVARGEAIEIWGWAWADGGVSAVDVTADGDLSTLPATLEPATARSWQRFAARWRPARRGACELLSKAQSADGRVQPDTGARNAVHRVPVEIA